MLEEKVLYAVDNLKLRCAYVDSVLTVEMYTKFHLKASTMVKCGCSFFRFNFDDPNCSI